MERLTGIGVSPGLVVGRAVILTQRTEVMRFPIPGERVEREVAALLIDGGSNKHIARALDISVHTAKFHVATLLQKLHARNRAASLCDRAFADGRGGSP